MGTHKVTIEVTDEELELLQFYASKDEAHFDFIDHKIAWRVKAAAPKPKRYLKVGDVLGGGNVVTYISPHVCVGRWTDGEEASYSAYVHDGRLYMEGGGVAYFPESQQD